MEIKDKVVVVTGGASGIGEGLCERFAKEGARGIAVADIDTEGANRVADAVGGLAIACDVSKETDMIELVAQTEERLGPIDLFCSNAGIMALLGPNAIDRPAEVIRDWERRVRKPTTSGARRAGA